RHAAARPLQGGEQLVLGAHAAPRDDARDQSLPLLLAHRRRISMQAGSHARFAGSPSRYACSDAAEAYVDGPLRSARRSRDHGCTAHRFAHLARRNRRGAPGETEVTKADQLVDKAAARLQELADRAAAEGGV